MNHRLVVFVGCLAASLAVTVGVSPPASAAKRSYEDKRLGFRLKIDDSWVQVPPKLGKADAYLVGDWYEDSAKFDNSLRPMFQVLWWAQSKAPPPMPVAAPPAAQPTPPAAPAPDAAGTAPEEPKAPDAPAPQADPAAPAPEPGPGDAPPPQADPPEEPQQPPAGDPPAADGDPAPATDDPAPAPEDPKPEPKAGDPAVPDTKPQDPAAPADPASPEDPSKKPDPNAPNPDPNAKPEPKPDPKEPKPDPKKKPADEEDDEEKAPPAVENINDYAGRILGQERYFGPAVPMADRWKDADSQATGPNKKRILEWFEVNPPTKRKSKDKGGRPMAYALVGQLTLDRPNEIVTVGFFGACGTESAKKMRVELLAMMKSFEDLKGATDSMNAAACQDLSQDPAVRRAQIRKTKVIKGWDAIDTPHYIMLFSKEVDPNLVRSIGNRIESIREQVYEVLFPPDKPVTAVSIVRVCKDPEQYFAYGGPQGSAGYWDDQSEELVFYESDQKEDSLRVLYHEAFHQFIYYSVGDVAPHSWFNEGHGDYFAGHDYKGGKFVRGVFLWRTSTAKEWKRNPKRPPLREWITWTQAQYYGNNKAGVGPGANYALGWSLVYFLRTTKKPEYTGVLDRYFKSLKGSVTRAREIDAAWDKKVKDAKAAGQPEPEKDSTSERGTKAIWMKTAVENAFQGVDWEKLEKDWLAADY